MKIEVDPCILFYAFRYALGRRTYAVSNVVSTIAEYINVLDANDLLNMRVEILKAIDDGDAGMEMDVREWSALQFEIAKELDRRGNE